MSKLKIYLDNCCYNRPFDDLSQTKINNEAVAKMFIQSLIKYNNRDHILNFVNEYSEFFVGQNREREILPLTHKIMESGIKLKDAVHLACSIFTKCDYFITTDKRVLNYKTNKINLANPINFVEIWRDLNDR